MVGVTRLMVIPPPDTPELTSTLTAYAAEHLARYMRQYRADNRERLARQVREWKAAHPDANARHCRAYRSKEATR